MITTINNTLFPLILFISFCCLYSSWFNSPSQNVEREEKEAINNFVTSLTEAFDQLDEDEPLDKESWEFSTEKSPEEIELEKDWVINNSEPDKEPTAEIIQPQSEINSKDLLMLPPAKPRRKNQTKLIKNPVIITPVTVKSLAMTTVPANATVRELRRFISEHNLQQLVKEKIGKSVSKCKKHELLKAIS